MAGKDKLCLGVSSEGYLCVHVCFLLYGYGDSHNECVILNSSPLGPMSLNNLSPLRSLRVCAAPWGTGMGEWSPHTLAPPGR